MSGTDSERRAVEIEDPPMVRALQMIDALPEGLRPSEDTPLRLALPGCWPSIGDLRAALRQPTADTGRPRCPCCNMVDPTAEPVSAYNRMPFAEVVDNALDAFTKDAHENDDIRPGPWPHAFAPLAQANMRTKMGRVVTLVARSMPYAAEAISDALAVSGTAEREAGAGDGWLPWATVPPSPDFYADLPGDVEDGVGFATSVEDGRMLFLVLFECTSPGCARAIRWQPLPRSLPLLPEGEAVTSEGGDDV